MITIGIDPGKTGAISFVGTREGEYTARVFDLPISQDGALYWVDGAELRSLILDNSGADRTVVVEKVWAMGAGKERKQGASSSFKFGAGFGSILGCLQCLGVRVKLVPSSKWKGDMQLDTGSKDSSLARARLLFPDAQLHLKKHSGRAEALLIAQWYLDKKGLQSPKRKAAPKLQAGQGTLI